MKDERTFVKQNRLNQEGYRERVGRVAFHHVRELPQTCYLRGEPPPLRRRQAALSERLTDVKWQLIQSAEMGSLALLLRTKVPGLNIIFVARAENEQRTSGPGVLIPHPVDLGKLVEAGRPVSNWRH